MKLLILYYSGTANTKFTCRVAKLVARKAGHEVVMKTFAMAGDISLEDFDALCFATPLQAWQPTKNVERFIKSMPPVKDKVTFLLSSSGGQPSQTPGLMSKWLKKKGIKVIGHHDLQCPDSWPVTRPFSHKLDTERPTVESVRELAGFTEKMLGIQEAFLSGEQIEFPIFRIVPTPLFWLSRFERIPRNHPNLEMGKKRVNESDCTQCGVCEKSCPARAIRLDPYPVFTYDCDACWRRINICPEDCITTRIASKYHYKGIPHKDKLLKEAGLL